MDFENPNPINLYNPSIVVWRGKKPQRKMVHSYEVGAILGTAESELEVPLLCHCLTPLGGWRLF